jgi:4-hydroxy-2-oxoheptanedioate aldolase
MRVLYLWAAGVVVPMVNSAAEAARAVAACRYAPAGERSWGPTLGDVRADGAPAPAEANAAVLCVVMVETRRGLDALEEIVAVPGIDAVYIGPYDLALSCGYGQATYRDNEEVDALLQGVVDTCRQAGVVAGLHCTNSQQMALEWAGRGVRLLTAATDTTMLRTAAATAWDSLRQQ